MQFPARGFVFWPVGCGDSTTIVVAKSIILQVDLHHLEGADDDDDPRVAVIDRLVELLPRWNDRPYLTTFALTHPDQDHCRGFAELLRRVHIGELWFSPRVFREFKADLCDDAKAFCKEAMRRVRKTIEQRGAVGSGDRVRIIGYDDLLDEDEYKGFPADRLTVPGNAITELNGVDQSVAFRAFVHAPFKDDADGERNDTSLAFQVTLFNGAGTGRVLLFGDLSYPVMKRIFTVSDAEDLQWNVLLAPHHCSKSAMYWCAEGEEEETLKRDILDLMEAAAATPGFVVSSSPPIPAANNSGDNPPHAKAKRRYQEIVPDEFLCTQEHPNEEEPEPIVFAVDASGFTYMKPTDAASAVAKGLGAAVAAARGASQPPSERVGFGKRC